MQPAERTHARPTRCGLQHVRRVPAGGRIAASSHEGLQNITNYNSMLCGGSPYKRFCTETPLSPPLPLSSGDLPSKRAAHVVGRAVDAVRGLLSTVSPPPARHQPATVAVKCPPAQGSHVDVWRPEPLPKRAIIDARRLLWPFFYCLHSLNGRLNEGAPASIWLAVLACDSP